MLNEIKATKEDTLSEKDFETLFGKLDYVGSEIKVISKGMSSKLAQKCYHMYKVPKDTTEAYIADIITKDKSKIKFLLEEDKGKAYNYIFDKLRSKEYLYIQRLNTKNVNEFKYKLFISIKVKKDIDKYYVLNSIIDEISHFFDIESQNIYDTSLRELENQNKNILYEVKNDEILYKVMFYGKPCKAFIYTEELEKEVESIINTKVNLDLGFCKVQDLDTKVIKTFRKSLYYNISDIDFSDETIDIVDKKTLFYAYIDDFCLSDIEKTVVNLTFQGYNVYKDEDINFFKDSLKQKSNQNYSKKYLVHKLLPKICKKLAKNSPFRDLEVSCV